MNFKWDDEKEIWQEGEKPKTSAFLTWVRNDPKEFFILFVAGLTLFSLYGGKIILWVMKYVFG